ncbi:T9SS type A sorting domain-containing protein [Flavobacterium amnicola]|uniref:T9SS type A sorting domain-containing protein n=1 Tax=Flavobacterium amnicola TaxID=2506422 RepID=A0A4Q1K3X1_9FLAO|nr:T9SS type A sorting domain-containing protein [Flavobacterium amnicola]RXR19101.1 T9SS type A sorting domain-containing protein [Flavobacterium amnicola]
MKKTTLLFVFAILAVQFAFGQVNNVVSAPIGTTTTQVRAPNGLSTYAFLRASSIVLASELTSIPAATSLNSFGLITTAGSDVPVTGTLTVYMQNSADVTFTKGTSWATIITGMTQVYSGSYTIPASATNIDLTLTTPFTYTGGSVYVAYDFSSAGPYSTTPATYSANNSLAGGCVSANSATVAPTTLGSTAFRPAMRFGFPNPYSNDVSVETINTLGNVATTLGLPVPVSALIRNKSNTTLTNINVSANMTGANSYADSQNIASLAAGASTTVNFANWTPTALGANVLSVTVPADQLGSNNAFNFNIAATCFTSGAAQNPVTYSGSVGFNTGSGIIATPIQNSVASSISGANVAISLPVQSVGNNVFGVLLNNAGAILAQSPNLTIANGDLGTIKTFTFPTPVSVAANQLVYVGLGQSANATTGYFPVGAYPNPNLTTPYYTTAITGGALALVATNLGQLGIEANFSGSCSLSIDEVAFRDKLIIYPNPANNILNIKFGSFRDSVNLEVYNTLGQIVLPAQKVFNDTYELNVSSLNKGVYFLKVSNNKEMSNLKFTIER